MRLGLAAREALKAKGYFDLEIEVRCPLKKPFSCLIDGIIIATGCTPGKRNLTLKDSESPEVVAHSHKGGAVSVRPKRALWRRLSQTLLQPAERMHHTAEEIISASEEEVLEEAYVGELSDQFPERNNQF